MGAALTGPNGYIAAAMGVFDWASNEFEVMLLQMLGNLSDVQNPNFHESDQGQEILDQDLEQGQDQGQDFEDQEHPLSVYPVCVWRSDFGLGEGWVGGGRGLQMRKAYGSFCAQGGGENGGQHNG